GVNDVIRWTERPVLTDSVTPPPDDRSVILLARLTLKAGGAIDVIDTNTVPRAAVSAIAPGSIREDQIVNGSVTDPKIAGMDGAKLINATVSDAKIAGMDGAKLVNATVTDAKIVGMDGAKLVNATVTDAKIVGMDGAKLVNSTVSDAKIVAMDGA